jgi:glycosyltransferase family protein
MSRVALPDLVRSVGLQALAALGIHGAPLRVVGERETLRALCERRASLARYGDGELEIMIGRDIHFQEYHPRLARRLREVLQAASRKFLVGVPNFDALQIKTASRKRNWERYRLMFSHLIRRDAEYHSAFVSRPASVVGLESAEYFQAFAPLWEGRDVVLVHHDAKTVKHPLLSRARSSHHVACPPRNAFDQYDALLAETSARLRTPDVLFLIAAGPTAGVLAWDLAQRGAQALDIGHLTNAYDEFLRKQ